MKRPRARRLVGAATVVVLLLPVAWTKQICDDDWADVTSPVDNPQTPAPDLYANKRFEDGVQSMPDLRPSTPAQDVVEILPTGHDPFFAETLRPDCVFFTQIFSDSPRAPPALSAG
jgi:hypothetical protein